MSEIERRLADLKKMREKDLISQAAYESRQQAILAEDSASSLGSAAGTFLDPKRNLQIAAKIAIASGLVLAAIWIAFQFSGREGRDSISQFASQTGIGKQVIPWSDLADTAARKLVERNKAQLAGSIQSITHPTGKDATLTEYSVSKLPDRILINLKISWKGGLVGNSYLTLVAWEIGKSNHISAKVTADSSVTGIDVKNHEMLNDFFRTKVYPVFVSDLGT